MAAAGVRVLPSSDRFLMLPGGRAVSSVSAGRGRWAAWSIPRMLATVHPKLGAPNVTQLAAAIGALTMSGSCLALFVDEVTSHCAIDVTTKRPHPQELRSGLRVSLAQILLTAMPPRSEEKLIGLQDLLKSATAVPFGARAWPVLMQRADEGGSPV